MTSEAVLSFVRPFRWPDDAIKEYVRVAGLHKLPVDVVIAERAHDGWTKMEVVCERQHAPTAVKLLAVLQKEKKDDRISCGSVWDRASIP